MVFGTFQNPKKFKGVVGFSAQARVRITDMLLMRDVNK
jgi:hypothetical protein